MWTISLYMLYFFHIKRMYKKENYLYEKMCELCCTNFNFNKIKIRKKKFKTKYKIIFNSKMFLLPEFLNCCCMSAKFNHY